MSLRIVAGIYPAEVLQRRLLGDVADVFAAGEFAAGALSSAQKKKVVGEYTPHIANIRGQYQRLYKRLRTLPTSKQFSPYLCH